MALVYSCCFWFSLRLGGILIGILSILQALAVLIVLCLAYTYSERFHSLLYELTDEIVLIYTKEYIENLKSDPERYIKLGIATTSFFIIVSLLYIYGAYMCNNMLMIPYILCELIRLIMLTITVATTLLVLKQNTMDIGMLIGASVAAGFFLLGEFYLWVCSANLPILINEINYDEQAATIEKLQQLLQSNGQKSYNNTLGNIPLGADYGNDFRNDVFVIPKNTNGNFEKLRSRIPINAPDPHMSTYYMRR